MAQRPERPLLLIDIAVPRDIDPGVRDLPNVRLYDIDELQAFAEKNLELRRGELASAEAIIEEDVVKYGEWLRSLAVVPTVAALQARADAVAAGGAGADVVAHDGLSAEDRGRIEAMTAALVKKLLHAPIRRLKNPGDGERYTEAARALFGLDDAVEEDDFGA